MDDAPHSLTGEPTTHFRKTPVPPKEERALLSPAPRVACRPACQQLSVGIVEVGGEDCARGVGALGDVAALVEGVERRGVRGGDVARE